MVGLAEIYLYSDESYLALLIVAIMMTTFAGLLEYLSDLRAEMIELLSENKDD